MKLSLLFLTAAFALARASTDIEYSTVDIDYAYDEDSEEPRSMIMMIPDGTAPEVFTLARTLNDPKLKKRLHLDPLAIGMVQTHSSSSYITDSAAASTAYATGFKTYDAAISVDDQKNPLGTILEAAKARNMVTGMVVTSRVTHATPAGFASHVADRDDEQAIADQYVENKNLDFMYGGGAKFFQTGQIDKLKAAGYSVVTNYQEMIDYQQANEASGNLRVFGLFHKDHMSFEVDRVRMVAEQNNSTKREPSLAEMVDSVLKILKNNKQAQKHGFFMMVEGSRVDHAGHNNDPGAIAKEALAFDESVGVVKQFVHDVKNTALLCASDHGTGGMSLGLNGIYAWYPDALRKQTMSTEMMSAKLKEEFKNCPANSNATCKANVASRAVELLTKYTNLTGIPEDLQSRFDADIAKAVDKTNDFGKVMVTLGHAISEPALVGWTTTAHVGTDVTLYCMGPSIFEHMCRGTHENVRLNSIMAEYLHLNEQKETLKRRGYEVHDSNEI